jgi:phosphate transport system permease protein
VATSTSTTTAHGTHSEQVNRRRSTTDRVFWGLCGLAFLIIAAPTVSILISIIHQAMPAMGWQLFTHTTGAGGGVTNSGASGIENAILGTLILLLGVLIVAGTIGMAAGVYLAEFAGGRPEKVLRFFSEVLAGTPSIVIGYIGYVALVVGLHWGYSLLAAILALSALVLPYIVKTTEVALRQVPTTLREGAAGLGMARTPTLFRVIFPTALPGIVSGLIVALAISTGELAPLLFTANSTDFNPSFSLLHRSVPYLTEVIYNDLAQPGKRAHATAAAAGLVAMVILIVLIVLGRIVAARARRSTARMTV